MLNKPLSTVRDSADILYRLGLVLEELDVGVGLTVLDFGAGSCWLSSHLNRLRCKTVSIDVSPTALKLGRELFEIDPRHKWELEPQFLPYDGHRIPLPDESVDRVVCFDAFHHVPNQREVLSEIHRVLRTGGRAVFAEPGEGHSHAEQSVMETETSGVLENDLDMRDVIAKAREAGFDRVLTKPYPHPRSITLAGDEYVRLMEGDDALFPIHVLRDDLRHFYVFILTKGAPVFDSRNPRELKAEISVLHEGPLLGRASERVRLPVRVRNVGDTIWLHELTPYGGYVSLGGHLLNEQGEHLTTGFARALLPRSVRPGESVEFDVGVDLPSKLGRFVLKLDMVDEWITWFAQGGSQTSGVALVVESFRDSREPHRLGAEIALDAAPPTAALKPGSPVSLPLRLANTGDTSWLHEPPGSTGTVSLGGRLLDADGTLLDSDLFRVSLPRSVDPGDSVTLESRFAAPPAEGRYRLQLDLVAEGICWFQNHGSPTLELDLEASAETPDSSAPGLLEARIELVDAPPRLALSTGQPASLELRVTNLGNTLWLAGETSEHGCVGLGAHLTSAAGELLELDLLRVALPRPVAPGEQVTLRCALVAPTAPGRYRVLFDMVDEGIAWFEQRGSKPVSIELVVL